jgi:hypothetical protein
LWRPGKSPKEHEEMTFLQEVEARNARWREEEVARSVEFESRMNKFSKDLHDKALEEAQKARKWSLIGSIMAACVGLSGSILVWWLSRT